MDCSNCKKWGIDSDMNLEPTWYDTYDHRGEHVQIDTGDVYTCPICSYTVDPDTLDIINYPDERNKVNTYPRRGSKEEDGRSLWGERAGANKSIGIL